jgi:hypothetical protein
LDVVSIEQGHLLVVGVPMILQLLGGPTTGRLGGRVEGFSYLTPKTSAGLAITGDRVLGVKNPSMHLHRHRYCK